MKVRNGFASVSSIVDHGSESIFRESLGSRDFTHLEHHMPERFLISRRCLRNSWNRTFRDEQEMGWRLRRDITEAKAEIVLIDNVGRNLTCDDFFKEGSLAHLL